MEDIIGSAKYVPLIEQKEVEVEKLNDSRGEVLNRVKVCAAWRVEAYIVEMQLNRLEFVKKEDYMYLRKEREVAQEQALLYQFYLYEGRKSNEKVTRQLADTNKRLEETRVGVGLGGEA